MGVRAASLNKVAVLTPAKVPVTYPHFAPTAFRREDVAASHVFSVTSQCIMIKAEGVPSIISSK